MNGGAGLRRRSPRVTVLTTKAAPSSEAMMARVASSFRRSAFSPAYSRSAATKAGGRLASRRSEEHTSELQSRLHLVCRLLLEKKKKKTRNDYSTITIIVYSFTY